MSSEDSPPPSGFLPSWFQSRLDDYIGTRDMVQHAGSFYLWNLWAGLRQGHLGVLFGRANQEARDKAFAEFYQAVGHRFAAYEDTTAVPSLVASAHGVVLDLGPGTGNQVGRFDAARVAHVYGVEPNAAFVPALAARLAGTRLGAEGRYTLLPCGLEDVEAAGAGVVEGSMDCVVSMQVMCSLPNLEDHVRHMHRLLKPGGELIFWEHCRSPDRVTRAVQWLWCFLWQPVIGGCRLDRVTLDALVKAADWEIVDVHSEMEPHMTKPRIWGRLVKPRAA